MEDELARRTAERDALQSEVALLRKQLAASQRLNRAVAKMTEAFRVGDVAGIAQAAFAAAQAIVVSPAASIYLHEPETKRLRFAYVSGSEAPFLSSEIKYIPDTQGLAGHVFQSGKVDVTTDIKNSGAFDDSIDRQTKFWTSGLVVTMPLKSLKDKTFGVFQILNGARDSFLESDMEDLNILADFLAVSFDLSGRDR